MKAHSPQPAVAPVQLTLADAPLPSAPDRRSAMPRRTYNVEEAADILGISRSHAYECVRSGEIPSLRLRRRIVVPAHALDALLGTGET
jgi:excisionase family DNA binding protein